MGERPFILSRQWKDSFATSEKRRTGDEMRRAVLALALVLATLAITFQLSLAWYQNAHPYLYALRLGPTTDDLLVFALISTGAAVLVALPFKDTLLGKHEGRYTPPEESLLNTRAFLDQTTGYWVSDDGEGQWYWWSGQQWVPYS